MGRRKKVIANVQAIDIGDKGKTIGKTESGEIVLIDGGCVPGDTIDFLYLRKKKGMKYGVVKELKTYSSDRVEPFCDHFGTCGGCKWQNLDYAKQLELKAQNVRQAIQRLAKEDPQKVEDIIGADPIRYYRNKLEYTFSTKRWLTREEIAQTDTPITNRKGVGFHIAGAFDKVLHIETCHLQDTFSNTLRNAIDEYANAHELSYYDIRKHEGLLRNMIVRNSTLDEWMVTMVFGENNLDAIDALMKFATVSFPQVTSWHYVINTKHNDTIFDLPSIHVAGRDHIKERLDHVMYRISPKSFFQTNSTQACRLYQKAKALADPQPDDIIYDLYTGTGSIALYFADACRYVVGIEQVEEAIADARANMEDNDIKNAKFLVGDVKAVLRPEFKDKYGAPNIVITDPPRAGMHPDVVATILELAPPKVVYISCNPSTQARDLLLLQEKYELVTVTPVDMFPHTSHIESIALLKLSE